jgi:Lsr2
MAQKVNVLLLDDLVLYQTDGKEEEPATQTVEFALDGKRYRIDLNENNADELRLLLEPYIQAASEKLGRSSRPRSRTVASRQRSREIRDWAEERGYQVSDRGRIPAAVVAEYDEVH